MMGCGGSARVPNPTLMVVGDSQVFRGDDAVPQSTPWFDGTTVTLAAARGETIGIQVLHAGGGAVKLVVDGAAVTGYAVSKAFVARPSTELYGPSRGSGAYPDGLTPEATPDTDPAYFSIAVPAAAKAGKHTGTLTVDGKTLPVVLEVATVTLPEAPPRVWAYEDPRELGSTLMAPNAREVACIEMFRDRGVLLSPDLPVEAWRERTGLLVGAKDIPAVIPDDPATAGAAVKAWIEATAGTGKLPFAIPIDEPGEKKKAQVIALAKAVRAAGGGPTTFRYAITGEPDEAYGDLVDLYIELKSARPDDKIPRWVYNGRPPRAGAMVVDTPAPGMRTWGWIAWRYKIPEWYVWDALYWHDRHNKKRAVAEMDPADAVTFDDGDDHGNLDGVLALPDDKGNCRPTLRLEALRRGLEDWRLLDAASACKPDETAKVAAKLVPAALGDAGDSGHGAWPEDDAAFERARRELLSIAASCGK